MKTRSRVSLVPCIPDEGRRLYSGCSLCSYYLQRQFTYTIFVIIYIPLRSGTEMLSDITHSTVAKMQTQHPEALMLISGDVTLDKILPALSVCGQHVDLLYANLVDASSGESRSQPYAASASLQTKSEEVTYNHVLIQEGVSKRKAGLETALELQCYSVTKTCYRRIGTAEVVQ